MKAAVLTIKPNGMVFGLHTEAIPFAKIGSLTINRLTEIEFSNSAQKWEVRDRAGTLLYCHVSRQRCLDWENRQFNQ